MSAKSREFLKRLFRKSYFYNEERRKEFEDFIDSFWNFMDDGGDPILHAELELTSEQILLLNTNPIEIVPAPSGGKSIIPISAWATITPVVTEYFTNTNLVLTQDVAQQRIISFTTILLSVVEKTIFGALISNSAGVTTQIIPETSLKVHVQNGNPTGGDGSLKIHVLYMLK